MSAPPEQTRIFLPAMVDVRSGRRDAWRAGEGVEVGRYGAVMGRAQSSMAWGSDLRRAEESAEGKDGLPMKEAPESWV